MKGYAWERPERFRKETKGLGLSRDDATKLSTTMRHHTEGRTTAGLDYKPLGGGLFELRVRLSRGSLRLYFAPIGERLVLLCLHVHFKKKQNDRNAVDLARKRLREHQRDV